MAENIKHDASEDVQTTQQEEYVSKLLKALDICRETATSQMSLLEEYPMFAKQLNEKVVHYDSSLRRWKNLSGQLSDDLQNTLPSVEYPDLVHKLGVLSPQIQNLRTTQQDWTELVRVLDLTKERSTPDISLLEDYPTWMKQLNKKVDDYISSLLHWQKVAGQLSDDLQGTLPSKDYQDFVQKLGVLSPRLPDQVREFFSSHGRDLGTVNFDLADLMMKMDKLPTAGQLLCKIPASGDISTSGRICDMAWDHRGHLLVGQTKPDRLDRIEMNAENNQLLAAVNICKESNSMSSVSVSENGDFGAVIFYKGVNFYTPSQSQSTFWEMPPSTHGLSSIVMFIKRVCICSDSPQSTLCVYNNTGDRSLIKSIPLRNEGDVLYMAAVDNNTLVISECDKGNLYLVNIETEKVTKVTPKYPDGMNVLSDPWGVSCDQLGRIYVCNRGNKKVIVLSREGEYLTTLGGDLEGALWDPRGLAVHCTPGQCTLAVSDNKEVKIYALEYTKK